MRAGDGDDLGSERKSTSLSGANALDRPLRGPGLPRKPSVRLVDSAKPSVNSHGDIFTARMSSVQDKNVPKLSLVVSDYSSTMPKGNKTDEESIAAEILAELWPKGTWPQGSQETGIPLKTFGRICKGGAIKQENWARLKSHDEFAARFAKRTREAQPDLSPSEKEAIGRLARAFGPRNLKSVIFELETLSAKVGAGRALRLLELQTEAAAEVIESVDEFDERQKTVD